MTSLRMLLSAVSLSIIMLLWPPASPASPPGPKSCAELMKELYELVRLEFVFGDEQAKELIKQRLPALKAACPTEANSIRDLENGNYLKTLAARRERNRKAERHIKDDPKFDADMEQFLEVLR